MLSGIIAVPGASLYYVVLNNLGTNIYIYIEIRGSLPICSIYSRAIYRHIIYIIHVWTYV